LILHPRLALADDEVSGIAEAPQILSALVDVILPAHEVNPGGLALGIDQKLIASFTASPGRRLALKVLIAGLGGADFLALDSSQRERSLRAKLTDSSIRPHLEVVLSYSVTEYYADRRSWAPIGYTTPQPGGYPDYADCENRENSRAKL